jgi:hypothetical protein
MMFFFIPTFKIDKFHSIEVYEIKMKELDNFTREIERNLNNANN